MCLPGLEGKQEGMLEIYDTLCFPVFHRNEEKNACRYTTADIAFFLRVKIKKRTQKNYVRSELLGQKSLAIPISVGFTLICTLT